MAVYRAGKTGIAKVKQLHASIAAPGNNLIWIHQFVLQLSIPVVQEPVPTGKHGLSSGNSINNKQGVLAAHDAESFKFLQGLAYGSRIGPKYCYIIDSGGQQMLSGPFHGGS